MDPATLTAEITESTAMLDSGLADTVLHELRALGLNLALDDFGAGYSSLDRVRRLPFNVLKIDRSFMREIPGNDGARAIVTSVVSLARSLGIKAVAEGVETAAQLDFVVDLGCPYAQGFLLARPMPAAEAQALLAGNPAAHRAV